MRLTVALGVLSLPFASYAAVTVTVSNISGDQMTMAVTGDAVPVTITLAGGAQFDEWRVGSLTGAEIITQPRLYGQTQGRYATITVTGPVSGRAELDNGVFVGGTITVAGQTASFVQSGGTWSATAGAAPEPPTDPSFGSATLSWIPPTARADGSPLTNLAGYKIYWGCTAPGAHPNVISVNNPGLTAYVVEGLPTSTTCYFVVTAVDSAGVESLPSAEVVKQMPDGPSNSCTIPQPADETRTQMCSSGTVGSWTQTRTYEPAAYPTCWVAGSWLPATAPAGACTTPPPPDPCVADPLVVTVTQWPSGRSGSRTLTFSTGNKSRLRYTHDWPLSGPQTLTVTDTRGCTVTVTR